MKFKERLENILNLPTEFRNELQRINDRVSRVNEKVSELLSRPVPKPFVQVLVFGDRLEQVRVDPHSFDSQPTTKIGGRASLAESAFVDVQHSFRIQPNFPICNLQIIIVCDTSLIRIDSIQCANEQLSCSYENAPIAYFKGRLGPENVLIIHVDNRLGKF